jgi:hypothetical protein
MNDWRELVVAGKFSEAESMMLAEASTADGYGGDVVLKAAFYENWGDSLQDGSAAKTKYLESHRHWADFASGSSSGGEGAARMLDVNRVLEKIESLG